MSDLSYGEGARALENSLRLFVALLSAVRLLPHIGILILSAKNDVLWSDLDRWSEQLGHGSPTNTASRVTAFVYMMTFEPAYRNVFYLRHRWLAATISWLCRPMAFLEITAAKCGPGLFIQHGFGTTVSADEIGKNCWINQHVVIGYVDNSDRRPSIGDDVIICAGAKILGGVKVGSNSRIAANSLVLTDVPPDVTVMGVPASIVWRTRPNSL